MLKPVMMVTMASVAILTPTPGSSKTDQVSRKVSYADLDLSTSDGQRALRIRIASAVRQICGDGGGARSAFDLASLNKCEDEAWSSSRRQVTDAVARATTGRSRQEVASR